MAADTPCLFGMTNVRVGTRVIAIFYFWIELVNVLLLLVKYHVNWGTKIYVENKKIESYDLTFGYKQIDLDVYTFSEITNTILVMYTCYYLRKATYDRNLIYVHFWLVVNCINFITSVGFVVFASLRLGIFEIFAVGLLSLAFECYKLYVVYTFYMDEMYSVPAEGVVNSSGNVQNANGQINLPNGVVDQSVHFRNEHVVELPPEKSADDRY